MMMTLTCDDADAGTNEATRVRPLPDDAVGTGAPVTADTLCLRRHKVSYADPVVMPTTAAEWPQRLTRTFICSA